MDYAIQLLLPVIGGLMLGIWLTKTYHLSPIWTVVLAILGMIGGIGVIYKRFSYPQGGSTSGKLPTYKGKASKSGKAHSASSSEQSSEHPGAHIKDLDFLYREHHDQNDHDDWKELDDLDADEKDH